MVNTIEYQDWGFKFTGIAIDNFIRDIESDTTLNSYPEFYNRRNYAEELMFDLVGQIPCLFYVTRQAKGREVGEQIWGLTIATDVDEIELPEKLRILDRTLGIRAVISSNRNHGLKILSTRLLPINRGKKDTFSQPFYLRLRSNYQHRIGVPSEAIKLMANMPLKADCIPTEQQLEAWKVFVNVEENLAQQKQFCVRFVSHNYGEATRNITFRIAPESATVDGNINNSLELDDFWQRAKRARNQNINLKRNNTHNSSGKELGTIELINPQKNLLKINLDSEVFDDLAEEYYSLPQEGLLSFEAVGDIVQIRRKQRALRDLENVRTQNPYLSQFLFDASQARESQDTVEIQPQDLLLRTINPSQKKVVETVLSAPDLALIQGPPGTGKTTVIAEICYQVALRGGRTLIASQANLAVDNALSRLKHNPVIRAVRKGNKNSVGVEGEPFLEENVVQTWLHNTSADCEKGLKKKVEVVNILNNLFELISIFKAKQEEYQQSQDLLKNWQTEEKKYLRFQEDCKKQVVKIKNYLSSISLTQTELKQWSSSIDIQIYDRLNKCLEKRQTFTEQSINFPDRLQKIIKTVPSLSLNQYLSKNLIEFNDLIDKYILWDKCYAKANELDRQITGVFNQGNITLPNEETILKSNQILTIKQLDYISTLEQLTQSADFNLIQVRKPLSLWRKIIEGILVFASGLGLCQPSRRQKAIATLEVIRRQVHPVVRDSEPNNSDIVIKSVTPDLTQDILTHTDNWLQELDFETKQKLQRSQQQLSELEEQLKEVAQQIFLINKKSQKLNQDLDNDLHSINELLQTLPSSLTPEREFIDLLKLNSLFSVKSQLDIWQQKLDETEAYLDRYQNLISDWIKQLKNPSEQHRHELRRIYLDNANVIGITCSQSATRNFSDEFSFFDVVIIDEVSKCTPPELLIPALKAKKLVLVGDHKQLPPMLNNDTIEEIAEKLNTTTEELNYLKESLFKNLFESASDSIKKMLNIQYRMHPQIMGAINQFYENNLECGLTNPDEQRLHHLANSNIKDSNHVAWIKTPLNREYREKQDGTSFINQKEVEIIENLCNNFENTWSAQVKLGQPRKEIGIITFYGRQLKLIESKINPRNFPSLHIRTGTVDRFQGMERQIIIVSMVRNNDRNNIGFAKKPERVNVAFSRAQELLIIVGCHSLFTRSTIYSQVSNHINLHGGLIDV